MPKLLVCDDDEGRAADWCREISSALALGSLGDGPDTKVEFLTPPELASALDGLANRQRVARGGASFETGPEVEKIDHADILIVDHDLTPTVARASTDTLQGRSGEGLAMLARCFSSAGTIVLVNKGVQTSTFDLTMTRFADSYADLNVTDQDLGRSALWLGDSRDGRRFRPVHWPILGRGTAHLERIAESLSLEDRVLETLGLVDVLDYFEPDQLDVLGNEPAQLTFRELAEIPGVGLGPKDRQEDSALARIAVYGVTRWLTNTVLPGQNVLVDLPHLLERLPGLRNGLDVQSLGVEEYLSWAFTERVMPEALTSPELRPAVCSWLDRPVWIWPSVEPGSYGFTENGDEEVLVVCEDLTALAPIGCAREFQSGVAGPYVQRYVGHIDDAGDRVSYLPRNRLAR